MSRIMGIYLGECPDPKFTLVHCLFFKKKKIEPLFYHRSISNDMIDHICIVLY